jgi:hypothetical protein
MAEESKAFKWIRRKENIPEIYCNYVHSSWTLFDVRIQLGQLVPLMDQQPGFVVEEMAAVTFSWNQAKLLRDLLNSLVESFEKANGEIKELKLPDGPTPPAKATEESKTEPQN